MIYNNLGKSALQVSKIGFGCMSLKGSFDDAEKVLNRAIDLGINYFDTADLYENGANETKLGRALAGRRKNIILATKVGNQMRADGSGWDWNPRKEYILTAVDKSLKRLQTDYIDLYQLHGGTINDPIDEVIEAFEILQQQGKIRLYGISSIRPNVIREYVQRSNIVSVMMQYSLLDRRPEEECLKILEEKGISVLVRGAVAQGLLVDKNARTYLAKTEQEVSQAAAIVKQVSANKRTAAQTSILYTLSNNVAASAVVGIRTIEQLEEAVNVLQVEPLSKTELSIIRESVKPDFYTDHR